MPNQDVSTDNTKTCEICNQTFRIDASGRLVIPFFEIHSQVCEICQQPYIVSVKDNIVSYSCRSCSRGGAGSRWIGYSNTICPFVSKK